MIIGVVTFVQEQGPTPGTILWWAAVLAIVGILGAGLWRILTAGTRLVRFLARMESAIESLARSVAGLSESDAERTRLTEEAGAQIASMSKALVNVATLGTTRYENHETRIGAIEKVPAVKRAL